MTEALLVLFMAPFIAAALIYVIVLAGEAIIGFAGGALDE
jgi:hypothetical protein